VKLGARTRLPDVSVAVGDALRRAGIRAVLTGGACASLYSGGRVTSVDADFVIRGSCTTEDLDRALAPLGFERARDRYIHARIPFFVEFPRGPLGIGEDLRIRPVWKSRGSAKTLALSATDACRDRLAAFYHWNDRQSLAAAVAIAERNRVALARVRDWSRREGHVEGYRAFLVELRRARGSKPGPRPRPKRRSAPRSR
jgi:hypothetical protein